jgi:dihydroorotase
MTSERPASLYGIKDRGAIRPGAWADMAIVDINARFVVTQEWLKSKCGWSPFEGRELTGKPVHTVVNGKIVVRDAQPNAPHAGRMVDFSWK